MKKYLNVLLVLAFVFIPTSVYGQSTNQPTQMASLSIDLWPDYDRPELLVIMSGRLSPETPLPAEITLPLPEQATVNAVARFTAHNVLVDDLTYTAENNQLTFITPDASFQIEYYQPYQNNGSAHEINFSWTAPLAVQQLLITVQEPAAATDFTLSQEVVEIRQNTDNLRYHVLPPLRVNQGDTILFDVTYGLPEGSLSRSAVEPSSETAAAEPIAAPPTAVASNNGWLYGLGSVMLVFSLVMIGWGVYDRRKEKAVSKPKRKRTPSFCPKCGQAVKEGAKFCANCGHAFKGIQ